MTAAAHNRFDDAKVFTLHVEAPRPLRRPMRDADPFPLAALGPLVDAVRGCQAIVEAPVELCAQSALSHASLAVQGFADVVLPNGQPRPSSLFLLSIAQSGDRKSAADSILGKALEQRERQLTELLKVAKADHRNAVDAWTVARNEAKQGAKGQSAKGIADALDGVGGEPAAPREAVIAFPDPTIEGLQKYLAVGQSSLGLFADEGGLFTGGHGMSKENTLKTAAGFSKLWDGSPIKRLRAGDGNMTLFGRRVALHLMLQPEAANAWLSDPVLRDQGLFSRMLIAAPHSLAGTRFGREAGVADYAAVNGFTDRLLSIYGRALRYHDAETGELDPRHLPMTAGATAMWWAFRDAVEAQCGANGKLAPISGLANKICEHAARLAAVLALFGDLDLPELTKEQLADGIALANWYLGEALRLAEVGYISDDVRLAETLLNWLKTEPVAVDGDVVALADIYRVGPNSIREASVAQKAVGVLVDHGWLTKIDGGSTVKGSKRKDAYKVRLA